MVVRFFTRGAGAASGAARGAGAASDAARGAGAASDAARGAGAAADAADAARGAGTASDAARGAGAASDAARGAGDASDAARGAGAAGDATKARKSSFLSKNAGTLLTGGLVAGGVLYLDDKYKQEEKDVKDCMKVCLPDNWDDYAYGDLDKSDLKYKELSDVGSAEQPICTPQIENCGAYCGDKCKEIHDYDAPGSGLVGGLAGDAGDATGGVLGSLFGGLFGGLSKGLGLDTSMVGFASSASSSMIMMVLLIMLLK
jgi:type II secretory pathway pseudopilin PulG